MQYNKWSYWQIKEENECVQVTLNVYLSELACYIDEVIDLIKIHVCFCYDIIKDSIRFA